MQTGISTASLFGRMPTEDALQFLAENNIPVAEVFLESYCEYGNDFGKILAQKKGDIKVHSVHTLTTQFEPQLYSINERAQNDAFKLLDMTMSTAQMIDASYYTFHGGARFKKTPFTINFERVGGITKKIMEVCESHGVKLAYENVHWAYYNYIGFFNELKKHVPTLNTTFDVKQARQSGIDYREFINEMGSSIVTVHLSDIGEDGKMCLPGKGVTDFKEMFTRLQDKGFDGAFLLEVYQNDFKSFGELFDSYNFVSDLAQKVFKR